MDRTDKNLFDILSAMSLPAYCWWMGDNFDDVDTRIDQLPSYEPAIGELVLLERPDGLAKGTVVGVRCAGDAAIVCWTRAQPARDRKCKRVSYAAAEDGSNWRLVTPLRTLPVLLDVTVATWTSLRLSELLDERFEFGRGHKGLEAALCLVLNRLLPFVSSRSGRSPDVYACI